MRFRAIQYLLSLLATQVVTASAMAQPPLELARQFDSLEWPVELQMQLPAELQQERAGIWQRIVADHRNYYGAENLHRLGIGIAAGSLMANTNLDIEFHENFQSTIRGATSDEWFEFLHANKDLGDGHYSLPIFAVAWSSQLVFPDSPLADASSEWGERSLRSFLVGAPALWLLQSATGASRPGERASQSRWQPFQDDNGVSGHSFMAALPFLNAAKMTDDRRLKTLLYGASTLGALSRVNDGAHYPSQAMLGWWLAFLAVDAVDSTQHRFGDWQLSCSFDGCSSGLFFERKF